MTNNLFVSYDLKKPGQNYDAVIAEIKTHGNWAKVHYSLFYLSTYEAAKDVASAVWAKMDPTDTLLVVDAKNKSAFWYNLSDEVSEFVKGHWAQ